MAGGPNKYGPGGCCGCGGSTGPAPVTAAGCPCAATGIPAVLSLAVVLGRNTQCSYYYWQSAQLTYGAINPATGQPAIGWASPVFEGTECSGVQHDCCLVFGCDGKGNSLILHVNIKDYDSGTPGWSTNIVNPSNPPTSCRPFQWAAPADKSSAYTFSAQGGSLIITG